VANETSLTLSYGPLLTSTLFNYLESGSFADNIADATPTLDYYLSGDRIKLTTGGERLSVAIMHELNSTAQSYTGYGVLDTSESTGFTRAFFTNKLYAVSIAINGDELTANMGEAQLFDLLNGKTSQAEISLANLLSTDLFSTSADGASGITGLGLQIDSAGTYGTIDRSSNTAWASNEASVGAAATNLLPNLRTQYNNATQGKGGMSSKPDAIVFTQTNHEAFEALMFPFLQYTGSSTADNSVNAGLSDLRYKAARTWWDADATSGTAFGLNSAHSWLAVHRNRNMAMAEGGFQKPVNQDALVTQVLFKGNLVSNAPKKLFKLTGIT